MIRRKGMDYDWSGNQNIGTSQVAAAQSSTSLQKLSLFFTPEHDDALSTSRIVKDYVEAMSCAFFSSRVPMRACLHATRRSMTVPMACRSGAVSAFDLPRRKIVSRSNIDSDHHPTIDKPLPLVMFRVMG